MKQHEAPVRRAPLLLSITLLLAAISSGTQAHEITYQGKQVLLQEVVTELEKRTGFAFRLAVSREIETKRRDVTWQGRPLSRVLNEVSEAYGCDIFSVDTSGFFLVPAQKTDPKEVALGAYRMRAAPIVSLDDAGQVQLTLIVAAPDDERMEAIAGLGGDLRILDSFGRSLVQPSPMGIRRTTATRVRLTEYWHRLPLTLPDQRAARLRSVTGSLRLYRKVTPLRFEVPLPKVGDPLPPAQNQNGVEVRLEKWSGEGREYGVFCRVSWPQSETEDVVGRGISRSPQPYLVDAQGRVYRDSRVAHIDSREENGRTVQQQTYRFEGVEAAPARLVYEVFRRQDPATALPFRLADLPLPNSEGSLFKPELRPFYADPGGVLTFQVLDRSGQPLEGEVAIALSRQEPDGWSGWRWLETVTTAERAVRLENVRPGSYRVQRLFRFEPSQPPVAAPGAPLTVTLQARKEAPLPPLKLPAGVYKP